MVKLISTLLLSSIVVFSACDSSEQGNDDDIRTTLTGEWTGTVESRGMIFTFAMDLVKEMEVISGTGSVISPQDTANYNVQGTYLHPFVDMALLFTDQPGQPPMLLDATVTNDRRQMQGPVTGFGFGGETLMLTLTQR